MTYLEPCVTLVDSEPCHVQNPGIFRTQDIFRTLSRHFLTYSEHVYCSYIQNPTIFKILAYLAYLGPEAYSESSLFRYTQVYSDIFNNDTYDDFKFLFFHLNFTYFHSHKKRKDRQV